jgi:Rv2525c-like, glycoside hydrolase-like domain
MHQRIILLATLTVLSVSAAAALELRAAHQLTPTTGWALAGDHLLWTSSAGFQWSDITPPPSGRAIYGVYFRDASSGWLLRQAGGTALELAATSDAGAHWSMSAFPLSPADAAHFAGAASLEFRDAAHGWVMLRLATSSNFSFGMLFSTSDGGAAWTRIPGSLSWMAQPSPPAAALAAWSITQEGHCAGFKTNCSQQTRLLAGAVDITPPIAAGITPNSTGTGTGQGFDQCAVGTTGAMQTWWSDSPYRYTNMYIGGVNRACSQSHLSSGWVSTVVAQGWRLVPTWVGLQAPCTTCTSCSKFSTNTSTAASQGTSEATSASGAAASLGLTNTIVYYDLEAYNDNSSCSAAVKAFVNAWVSQMHVKGNLAGVYGSPSNANSDWLGLAHVPDDVWIADWNGQDTVWNLSPLSNSVWANHQRIHQYVGGHNETYGGVTFNMDTNDLDGAVTPSSPGPPPPGGWVGLAMSGTSTGFWTVKSDGGVFSYNGAHFYGSMGGSPLAAPVVGMSPSPDGKGYWLAGADGGVFSFGDAHYYGSLPGIPVKPNKPVVGIAATPDGKGYWMVAADGGIFSFGDAHFYGALPPTVPNAPIVGMAATPDGKGYWLVGADGGIFSYGDAGFYGSMGGMHLNAPVAGMARTTDGKGYWLAGADGGIFAFGDAPFYGSFVGVATAPVVGIVYDNAGGYMVVTNNNLTYSAN